MADSPIAYNPAVAPLAYYQTKTGTIRGTIDTLPITCVFDTEQQNVNFDQYCSYDGNGTWTCLQDVVLNFQTQILIDFLTDGQDLRTTFETAVYIDGGRYNQLKTLTYHRQSTTANDQMTAVINGNYNFLAGQQFSIACLRAAGTAQGQFRENSAVWITVVDSKQSSAGFIPPGTGQYQGEVLRWNTTTNQWEVTSELTVRDDGKVRGVIDTHLMPVSDEYTKINTNLRLVDELPETPGYNTLYFIVDPT